MSELIYVIDDDEVVQRLLEHILKKHGLEVLCYDCATTALNTLLNSEPSKLPQLILLDVQLPKVSGFELCLRLKQQEKLKHIPIIFISGESDYKEITEGLKIGAVDYITKPFQPAVLLARLNIHITLYRQAQQLKQQALELSKTKADILAIFNQFLIGSVILNQQQYIEFISDNCQYLLNQDKAQVIGKHWQQVFNFDTASIRYLEGILSNSGSEPRRFLLKANHKKIQVETEIKIDPTNSFRRILYFYDVSEVQQLREQIRQQTQHQLLGHSHVMQQVFIAIEQLAVGNWPVLIPVLIEGETGTGKELVAKAIHNSGLRKNKPFIALNCAGMTESLLTSQLFGHKKGAFTGAVSDQEGFFEAANGGTLFLDEIGDIPMSMQSSLLRVLQEQEIIRVGELKPRKVDVRVLAATHKDLAKEVDAGRFREDLLYRIRVGRIKIPPLRERKEDILLLAKAFLSQNRLAESKHLCGFTLAAVTVLENYHWPGNVRELKGCIDYAVIKAHNQNLDVNDLSPEIVDSLKIQPNLPPSIVAEFDEREKIVAALKHCHNNRSQAAKLLGISRATFYRRLSELKIDVKESK